MLLRNFKILARFSPQDLFYSLLVRQTYHDTTELHTPKHFCTLYFEARSQGITMVRLELCSQDLLNIYSPSIHRLPTKTINWKN